jgi:hypothetical protein
MAEAFSNSLSRAVGVITTTASASIGIYANHLSGISTVGISTGDIVDNTNYIAGTKVTGFGATAGTVTVDRVSTNSAAVSSASVSFLGVTSCYTSPAATKSILIGGTFANNTENSVNLSVEILDSSGPTTALLASKIPVPTGSSFVISDTGKTLLEAGDVVRVYCDSNNAIDVNLSILTGVS